MDPTVSRSSAVSSKYVEKTYYCETCKLSVMGREEYSDHLASVMHRLNLDRQTGRVRGGEGSRNSSERSQPREPERRDRENPKGSAGGSQPADPFLRDTSLDEAALRDEMLEATLASFYGINNTDSPIQIGKESHTTPSRSYDRGARSDSRERSSSSYDRDHRSTSYERDQAYNYDQSRSSYDRSGRGSSQRTGSAEWNRQDYEFSRGHSPLTDKSDHSSRLHDADRRYSGQYSQSSDAASRRYSGYDDRGYPREGSPHRDSSRSYDDRPVDRASYRLSDGDRDDRPLYSDARYSDSSRLRSTSDRFDDDRTQKGQSQRYPPKYGDEQFRDGTRSNYRPDDRRVDRSPTRDRHSRDLTPDTYKNRDYISGSIRESSVDRNNGPSARDAVMDISDPTLTAIELLKNSGITDDADISETAASIISQVLDGNFSLLPFGQNEEERPKTQKVTFVDQVQVQEIPPSGKSRRKPYDENALRRQAEDPFYPKTPKPTFDSPNDSPVPFVPETPRPTFDSSSSDSGNSPVINSQNLKVIPPYVLQNKPAYSTQNQEQPMDISPIHDAPSPSLSPSPPPPPPPPPPRPKDKQEQQTIPQNQPMPVAAPQSQPMPVAAPQSQPMPVAAPHTQPKPVAAPHTQPMPVPAPQSQPMPVAAPRSLPMPVAAPQSQPMPVAAPQSQPMPVAAPQSQPMSVAAPQNQPTPVAALPNKVAPVVTPQAGPGSTQQPQPVAAPQITQQPTPAALAVDQQSNAISHLQQQLGAALLQQGQGEGKSQDPNATTAQQQQTIAALQSLQQLGVALQNLQQANPTLLMPQIPGLTTGNQNPPDAAKNQNSEHMSDQLGDDMPREKRQTYREHREQATKQGGEFDEDYPVPERSWPERGRGSWPGRGWSSDTRGRGGWGDRGGRGGWGYGNRGGWGEWGERGRGRPDRGRGHWGDGGRGRGWGRGGYGSGSDPSWVTDASPDDRDRDRDRDRLNNRNPDGSRISRFDQPKVSSSSNLRNLKELPKIPKRETQTIPGARSLKSTENAERDKVMRLVNKPRSYTERVQIAKILHNHQQRSSKSRFSSHSSQHRPRGTTPLEIFNAGGVLKLDDLPEEVQREIAALLEREAEGDSDTSKPHEPRNLPDSRNSSDRRTSADSKSRFSSSSADTAKREEQKPPVKKLRCEHMLGDCKENEITPELLKDRKFKQRVQDPSLTAPASTSMRSLIDEILIDVKREKEDTINLKTSSNVDVKMDLSNLGENQIDMSFEKMDVDDDKVGGKRRRAESPSKSLSADAAVDDASKRRRVEGDGTVIIKSDPDELLKEGGPVAETLLKLSLHEEEIKRRLKLSNAAISRLESLAKRTVEQIAQRQSMRKKLIKEEMRLRKRRLIILKEVKPDTDITEVSSLDLSTSEWDSTSSIGDRLDLGSTSDSKKGNPNVKYMGTLKVDKTNPSFLKELSAKIEPVDNDDTKSQDSDSGSSKDTWFNKYMDKEKSHKNASDFKGSFKKKSSHDRERSKNREKEREHERSSSNDSDRHKKNKTEKKSAFPPPKTTVVLKSKTSSDKSEKRKPSHDKSDRKSEKEKIKQSKSSDGSKSSSYKKSSNDSSSSFKKSKDDDKRKHKSKVIVASSSESSDDEFDKRRKKKSRAVVDSSDSDSEVLSRRSRGNKDRGSTRKADQRMSKILKKYLHAPSSSDIDTDSDRKARPVFDIAKLKMRPVVELHRINVKEYKRKIRAGIAVSSPKPAKVKTKPAKVTPKPDKVTPKPAIPAPKPVKPAPEKLYQISPSAVPAAEKPLFSDSDSDSEALRIDLSVLESTPVKSIPPNPAYRIPNKEIKQCADAKSDKQDSENGDDKDSETKTEEGSVKTPESVLDSDSVASGQEVKSKESSEKVDMKVSEKKSETDSQEPDIASKPKSQDTNSKESEAQSKSGTSFNKEADSKNEASDTASEKPDIRSKTDGEASSEQGSDAPSRVDTTDPNSKEADKLDKTQVDNPKVSSKKETSDEASPEPGVSGKSVPEDPVMLEDVPVTPSSPSPEEAEAPSTKESDTLDKPEPEAPASPKEVEGSKAKESDNSESESPQSPEEAEAPCTQESDTSKAEPSLDQNNDVMASPIAVEKGAVESPKSLEGLLPLHFKGHTGAINAMHVWEDYLFTASDDQTARKYDIKTGECVAVYEGHKKGIQCITVFRSDIIPPMVFTGSFDSSVRGYNLETSEREARHKFAHRVFCFHQFSEKLYIGLGNGTVACLDVETDKVVETFRCAESPIRSLATSQEGGRHLLVVAANDCSITVRDIKDGLLIRTIEGHTKAPTDLQIAHNLVYSSAADKTMQVHDLHTGELVETLYHKGVVTSVCLHDDVLLTAGYEGLVRCFNLKSYDQNQLYYGAGHGMIMAMVVKDNKIITGNREGLVEAHTLDRSQHWACQFGLCTMVFGLRAHLEHHVVHDHLLPHQESVRCLWTDCSEFLSTKDGSEDAVAHFATHFDSLVPAGKR